MSESYFWYDLETSGTDPRWDRVIQFAGLRTDLELNETGERFVSYVRLPPDVLPSPAATLVTGITPERTRTEGIDEWQAFRRIMALFSRPGTCVAGYNSLRFDDEFVRYGAYRMLMDPYAREWQNGNSRWDLVDLVRAAYALRPEGIEWPREDDLPVFRLERLSEANGIGHASAHDALSDVQATVGLARLLREKQPKLFDYGFQHRSKRAVRDLLEPIGKKLCVHVSGMYGRVRACAAPVVSVGRHPQNGNSYLVADLAMDVRPLIEWSEDRLRDELFTPGNHERPGLKEVRINRCPFLAAASVARPADQKRLGWSLDEARDRQRQLRAAKVGRKLAAVYAGRSPEPATDVDAALYDGFLSESDRQRADDFQAALADGVWPEAMRFDDDRLEPLAERLKARCFPHLLSDQEQRNWIEFARAKLGAREAPWLTLAAARQQLAEIALSAGEAQAGLVSALDHHYAALADELGVAE